VADEDAIDKNSGAIGVHIELNFCVTAGI
jgi:hypothetical protein